MTSLYNCHTEGDAYRITKFSAFGDVESSYITTGQTCECPAGHRHTCRHRQMLPKFLDRGFVDSYYLYDFDQDGWVMNDLSIGQDVIPGNEAEPEGFNVEMQRALEADAAKLGALTGETHDISFHTMDDILGLHNAIADAVGEPRLGESIVRSVDQPQAQPKPWRRV